jgi:secreted trypsin-like serine protease
LALWRICNKKTLTIHDRKLSKFFQIIHKRWILTAGHCVDDIVKVEVFLGAITRYPNQVGAYIKAITVTRNRSIIPHPNYDPYLTANDVGLVELPEEAPIENIFIGLIALPQGSDLTRSLVGLQGTVSGFGWLNKNYKL